MIVMFTGKPGSGKSYKCVYDLMSKSINGKRYVFHNIDGLKKESFKNPDMVKDWREWLTDNNMTIEDFFCVDYQKSLSEKVKEKYDSTIVVVIDEAYNWLDKRNASIREWLAYHRHLGQDVYVIVQRDLMIASDYRGLVEYEIRAKNSSILNVPFLFIYQKVANGEGCGWGCSVKKKSVFNAYQSFDVKSKSEKVPWKLPLILVIVCSMIFVWIYKSKNLMAKEEPVKNEKVSKKVVDQKVHSSKMNIHQVWYSGKVRSVNDLRENYIYKGRFGDRVVVEEKETGFNYDLQEIAPEIIVMKITSSYVIIFDPVTKRNCRLFMGYSKFREKEESHKDTIVYQFKGQGGS